jgi:hypothetical protein
MIYLAINNLLVSYYAFLKINHIPGEIEKAA